MDADYYCSPFYRLGLLRFHSENGTLEKRRIYITIGSQSSKLLIKDLVTGKGPNDNAIQTAAHPLLVFMKIKSISRPIPIKLEPTPPRILIIPMTVLNNAPHRVHTRLTISSRRSLQIARESDGVSSRITCRRVGIDAAAELVINLLVRECSVRRRDK